MEGKITKRTVDATKPDPKRDVFLWDDLLNGFGLRVKPSGAKSYLIQYRNQEGRSRRYTFPNQGGMTPDEARKKAEELFALIRQGRDPASERDAQKDEPTFAEFTKRFLAEYVCNKKPRTATEYERMLEKYVNPQFATRKVYAITRDDVGKLHHKLRDTPYQANKVLALLSKMFNQAEAWGYRPDGTGAHAMGVYRPLGQLLHVRVVAKAEVVVRAEHQHPLPVHIAPGGAGALQLGYPPVQGLVDQGLILFLEERGGVSHNDHYVPRNGPGLE